MYDVVTVELTIGPWSVGMAQDTSANGKPMRRIWRTGDPNYNVGGGGSPTLQTLALTNPTLTTFIKGVGSTQPILNSTAGSTVTASGLQTGLTIDNVNKQLVWSSSAYGGAGVSTSLAFTETLAGATNTPNGPQAALNYRIAVYPAFSADPSITGTPAVGNVLTINDGTITGFPAPSVTARRFKYGSTVLGTSSTYTVVSGDLGHNIYAEVDVSNGFGPTVTGTSASVGPVIATLPSITITQSNATGTSPFTFTATGGATKPGGCWIWWEQDDSLTPAQNGDETFTTPLSSGIHFLSGDDLGSLDSNLGFTTPTGAQAYHIRQIVDDENGAITLNGSTYTAISLWSNIIVDTVVVATAVFENTTGADKSSFATVTLYNGKYRTVAYSAGAGIKSVRTPAVQAFNKAQFEVTFNSGMGLTTIDIGIDDGTVNLNTTGGNGGRSNDNGWCIKIAPGVLQVVHTHNTVAQTVASPTWANTDVLTVEVDKVNGVLTFWQNGVSRGSATGLPTLAAYHAYSGTSNTACNLTWNFGQDSWIKAPGAGVGAFWG